MAASKHIDKICVAVLVVTLVLTVVFMNGASLGLASADHKMGYEERLFSTDKVHQIDIVMDDWEGFLETCENEEYANCTVLIDGEKCGNVAIRAKGNTSLSSVKSMGSQRYSFKLEFDQYQKGKTYHGLDKLCLNNLIQDNTLMKDYVVYQMMDDFGVDAPLSSYAYLTVNGEDWGLYLAVEGVEDSFLSRNYGSETGELYKPDSMSFGGGRGNGKGFNMDDFDFGFNKDKTEESDKDSSSAAEANAGASKEGSSFDGNFPDGFDGNFDGNFPGGFDGNFDGNFPGQPPEGFNGSFDGQLPEGFDGSFSGKVPGGFGGGGMGGFGMGSDDVKLKYIDDDPDSYSNIFDSAKTDISTADKTRLIAALKNLSEYTDLENTLEIDEVLRYFVIHNFVVNGDSYTGSMIHNYYLHEKDGKLSMIPWDYNLAFGTFQGGGATNAVNSSMDNPVSNGSLDDRPMVGWIFSDEKYTEEYHEYIADFLEKWISSGKLATMIEETAAMLRPYVEKDPTSFCTVEKFDKGVAAMQQFVALRGEAVEKQLAGDDTVVDASDLNTSDMGSMGGGMGGNFGGRSSSGSDGQAGDGSSRSFGGRFSKGGSSNGNSANGGNTQTTAANTTESASGEASANVSAANAGQSGNTVEGSSGQSANASADPGQSGGADGASSDQAANGTAGTQGQFANPPEGFDGQFGNLPEGFDGPFANPPEGFDGQFGNLPEGFDGQFANPPQGADGSSENTENADGKGTESGASTDSSSLRSFSQMPSSGSFPSMQGGNNQMNSWILVGISVAVLALGIVVAMKIKH